MSLTELIRHWVVTEVLDAVAALRGEIMASFAELQAKFTAIQGGLDAIAADVQRLHDALAAATGGLSAAETEELAVLSQSVLDRVTAIDAATPEP